MPTVLERKLTAILAADIAGYSRLMHADEKATLATMSDHRVIVDELIARANGRIASTAGDGVLAEFGSVVDVVTCAVAIQQALDKANAALPDSQRMYFRIGVSVGDVVVKDGGVFGDGVNVAARLEALAEPGGVCVTRGVRDHVRDRTDFQFEDLGDQTVKNIPRPIRAFRVLFNREGEAEIAPNVMPARRDGAGKTELDVRTVGAVVGLDQMELAFWQSIEACDESGEYKAYLENYPNGAFAALAQARIERASKRPGSHDLELAFWDTVKRSDDPEMFQAYLAKYPEGEFQKLAEIKIRSLGAPRA